MEYALPRNLLQIPTTLKIVCACWKQAEAALQEEIREYAPNKHEEFIIERFHAKFAEALTKASNDNLIARAFFCDLKAASAYSDISDNDLAMIANGLIAELSLHEKSTERRTGGDMGLMIIRPQLTRSHDVIKISDYRRGILCQAKMKDKDGKWGQFTRTQRSLLPNRMEYLGLWLYSYKDEARRVLNDFQWYICRKGETLEQVIDYLKKDQFPKLVASEKTLVAVGYGAIGTDNDKILDEVISPAKNPALTIKISWRDGRSSGPGTVIYVHSTHQHKIQQHRQIRLQN